MTNIARLLSEGVGSWLHFEATCDRSGLFNEKYLSYPIGQILSARLGDRVQAEFTHPLLAPLMTGSGRRPQIDFAYCDIWPTPTIAVETKWIGRTKVSVEDIIWDLIRLEMIAASNKQPVFLFLEVNVRIWKRCSRPAILPAVRELVTEGQFSARQLVHSTVFTFFRASIIESNFCDAYSAATKKFPYPTACQR